MSAPVSIDVHKFQGGRGWMTAGFGLGAVLVILALAGGLAGGVDGKRAAMFSYLIAFAYWAGIALGALVLLMIFHAFNAKWMVVLRRPLEGMASSIPIFVLLFIPIAVLGMHELYSWVDMDKHFHGHELHLMHKKHAWLNVTFFLVRTGAYLAIAWFLSQRLFRLSVKQDQSGDPKLTLSQRRISCGGLPFIAVVFSFAAFDWLMSLSPLWFSTIFGVYYFAGSFLSTLCLLVIAISRGGGRDHFASYVTPEHTHNLGKLMLGFTSFWTYIGFSQFMLIWIANIPEEVPFFALRMNEAWAPVSILLIVGHFAIPFFALLSKNLKRKPRRLAIVAVWQLVFHFIDVYWLVMPTLSPNALKFHWTLVPAFLGVGLMAVAFTIWKLRGHFNVPVKDPYLAISLRYRQP